jgi:hypothetical protein
MLSGQTVDELLVIGSFVDGEGKSCKHATTFVRQLCGPEQTPVMLHLDCNEALPQCSHPLKLPLRETALLDFAQFDKYYEIIAYTFMQSHVFPPTAIADKFKFIKDIVEKSVVAEIV